MQIYNYAAFARVFELSIIKPNMTKIAQILFEPIIQLDGVFNHAGNPHNIDSKCAKAWYNQDADIPENIKNAAQRFDLVDMIPGYFYYNIIDEIVKPPKAYIMCTDLKKLDQNLTTREGVSFNGEI